MKQEKKTKEREKVPGGRGGVGWFGALLSPELLGQKGRMGFFFFLFPFLVFFLFFFGPTDIFRSV